MMSDGVRYRASVIIPTYNGKAKIVRLLRELSKQSINAFETIVVIDGSTDDTARVLNVESWDLYSLKIIEQANAGRAGARNAGAHVASSDILIFIDDDMVPTKTLVEEHFKTQQQYDIVVGKLDSYNDGSNPELLEFSYYINKKINSGIFNSSEKPMEIPYITANNFSIKRKLFQELNGFDGRLNDAEDFELAVRCQQKGYQIYYSEGCLAYHGLVSSLAAGAKRNKEYRNARVELLKYHPGIETYFTKSQSTLKPLKKPFFYIFSFKFWLVLADRNVFKVLPKRLRFKLYDIMLTANYHF